MTGETGTGSGGELSACPGSLGSIVVVVVGVVVLVVELVVVSPGVVTDDVVESVVVVVDDGSVGGGSCAPAGPSTTAPSPTSSATSVITGRRIDGDISILRRNPGIDRAPAEPLPPEDLRS